MDQHLFAVDQIIMRLINARSDLDDRAHAPEARALIARMQRAFLDVDAGTQARRELIATVLDASKAYVGDLDARVGVAESIIGISLPSAKIPADVLRVAVEMWPKVKQREARTRALHELARALDCDAPTLMTMLRQARQRSKSRTA